MAPSGSEAVYKIRVQRHIAAAMAVGVTAGNLLTRITRAAARVCESDMAAIAILTANRRELELVGTFGTRAVDPGTRVPLTASLKRHLITLGRSMRSRDALLDPRPVALDIPPLCGARGVLVVPLRDAQGPFGILGVAKRVPWHFTDGDAALLSQLGDCASIAIQTAQLRARVWAGVEDSAAPWPRARPPLVADGPPAPTEWWFRRPPDGAPQHVPPRERQVLALLIDGRTCKEVAATLCLSPRTVEHNVERLKLRFHQPTLHAVVAYALTYVL